MSGLYGKQDRLCLAHSSNMFTAGSKVHQSSHTTNVVVVNNQAAPAPAPAYVRTQQVYVEENNQVNHLLHLLIFILFPPWILVWIALVLIYGV